MIGFIICDPFPYIPYHALEEPRNLWRTRPISFVVARPLSVHLAGIRSASEGPLRTVWSTWRKPMNGAVNRQAMAGQTQRNWDWLNSQKKRMESRKPAVSGSWRGRIFSWTCFNIWNNDQTLQTSKAREEPFFMSHDILSLCDRFKNV